MWGQEHESTVFGCFFVRDLPVHKFSDHPELLLHPIRSFPTGCRTFPPWLWVVRWALKWKQAAGWLQTHLSSSGTYVGCRFLYDTLLDHLYPQLYLKCLQKCGKWRIGSLVPDDGLGLWSMITGSQVHDPHLGLVHDQHPGKGEHKLLLCGLWKVRWHHCHWA